MANHSSASVRKHTPHNTIVNALKRRAQAILNDRSIDPQLRVLIRYALETNDPWLADLVTRADRGETIIDLIDFSQAPEIFEDDSSEEKIEELAEIICRGGTEATTALFDLMTMIEDSAQPKVIANAVKHSALNLCAAAKP